MTHKALDGPRAAATRDQLYEAAAALFVERGYEDTTMQDIAERAGTSRRTAFNHFPRKSDIPMLWTRRFADVAVDTVAAAEDATAPERILGYFRLISQLVEAEPELSRQMMLGWTAATGPITYESQLLADLAPLLRDGQERGQVQASVDVDLAARTMSDAFMGVVFRWVREERTPRNLETEVDRLIELVLVAVRAAS
jgi:AcrR family transcriptional regulator